MTTCGNHNTNTTGGARCLACDIEGQHTSFSSGTRIAPAPSIHDVDWHPLGETRWEGIDGFDYTAKVYDSEDRGPYLNVQQWDVNFDRDEAEIRTTWVLPENLNLLKLIANGGHAEPNWKRTNPTEEV